MVLFAFPDELKKIMVAFVSSAKKVQISRHI
jgi:hypothetical protein